MRCQIVDVRGVTACDGAYACEVDALGEVCVGVQRAVMSPNELL